MGTDLGAGPILRTRTRTGSFAASPRSAKVRSENREERRSLNQSIHTLVYIDHFK
jgi:hypothetical protein